MYINGKMTMTFGQTTQLQQQQVQQQQIQHKQIQQRQIQIAPQQAPITTARTRGIRPMILGQSNKKGCRSCGSA
jgi:hypothetical protein